MGRSQGCLTMHADDGNDQRLPGRWQPAFRGLEYLRGALFEAAVPLVHIDGNIQGFGVFSEAFAGGQQLGLVRFDLHQYVGALGFGHVQCFFDNAAHPASARSLPAPTRQ